MDPDPLGGDLDPIDYSIPWELIEGKMGVGIVTPLGCGRFYYFPDPVPQSWIRIPTLDTKQLLSKFYVLLMWWGGDRGSAVG